MAAEPQLMAEASPRTHQTLAKSLKTLASKHKYVTNNFALNVNAGTPVVLVSIHSSDKRGGGKLSVDRCNCLTAGLCKAGGPWILKPVQANDGERDGNFAR